MRIKSCGEFFDRFYLLPLIRLLLIDGFLFLPESRVSDYLHHLTLRLLCKELDYVFVSCFIYVLPTKNYIFSTAHSSANSVTKKPMPESKTRCQIFHCLGCPGSAIKASSQGRCESLFSHLLIWI